MRKILHSPCGPVVFRDPYSSGGFLTHSSTTATEKVTPEGATHPVIDVDVCGASHPFRRGRGRVPDTAGQVKRFQQSDGRR